MTVPNDRDTEVFFLAAMFFYFKHQVRARFWEILQDERAGTDDEWGIAELLKLPQRGKVVSFFVEKLVESGAWTKCFVALSLDEGYSLLRSLEQIFGNQESCAESEGWSHYDTQSPDEFALDTAQSMLALLHVAHSCVGMESSVRVRWFEKIRAGQDRYDIVRSAVAEMLTKIKGTTVSFPLLAPIK